jgi:hypothetical protein
MNMCIYAYICVYVRLQPMYVHLCACICIYVAMYVDLY